MAELERLIQRLEADTSQFNSALRRARDELTTFDRGIDRTARSVSDRFAAVGRSITSLRGLLAGLGVAFSVREILRYADAFTTVQNQLRITGTAEADLTAKTTQLFDIANRTRSPIEALSLLYSRAAASAQELGASEQDLARFLEGSGQAVAITGGSFEQASGALRQLAQILGSARVQAEEFNSVQDGARPILQAVADGVEEAGGSITKLRQLVIEGRISGQEFFQAFLIGAPKLAEGFNRSIPTISQAMTNFRNSMIEAIGTMDTSAGGTRRLAQAINDLATAMRDPVFADWATDTLADAIDDVRDFVAAVRDLGSALGEVTGDLSDFIEAISGLSLTTPGNLLQNTTREIREIASAINTFQNAPDLATAFEQIFSSDDPTARIGEIMAEIDLLERRLVELGNVPSPTRAALEAQLARLQTERQALEGFLAADQGDLAREPERRLGASQASRGPLEVDIRENAGVEPISAGDTEDAGGTGRRTRRQTTFADIIAELEREAELLRSNQLAHEQISAILSAEGTLNRELTLSEQDRLSAARQTLGVLEEGRALGLEAEGLQLEVDARGRVTEELRVQQQLLQISDRLGEGAVQQLEGQVREAERLRTELEQANAARGMEDQLDQIRLIAAFAGQETEQYREQVALLDLKRQTNGAITEELRAQARELAQAQTAQLQQQRQTQLGQGIESTRLQLQFGGQDSEEFRVQEQMLQLRQGGASATEVAALEPQIREFERLQTQLKLTEDIADAFAETIAEGFIRGIQEGENFIDILGRIGEQLAAVAAQAVLEQGIRSLVGVALGTAFMGAGGAGAGAPVNQFATNTTGAGGAGFALPVFGGPSQFGGPRQHGGRVDPKHSYLVGEGGQAEMFVPDTTGMIVPLRGGGGAGGGGGQPTVINQGSTVTVNDQRALPFAEPVQVSQRTGGDGRPIVDVMVSDSLSRMHRGGQLDALQQRRGVRRS